MVDAPTSYLIVAISVVALLVFLSALRKVLRRGEMTQTAMLAVVIVVCTQISIDIVVTYLGDWQIVKELSLNRAWEWPGVWHQVWRALSLILGVIAAVMFLLRVRRGNTQINTPAVLLALLGLVSFASSVLHGDNPFRPVSVVYVVLLIACTVAPRGLGIHVGVAICCTIVALASGFTFLEFLPKYGYGVMPCTADKCGILNFDFSGVMENENGIAIFLALAMPFVYIGFGHWEGIILSAYMLGLVMLTGSRSGTAAAIVTFAVLVVVRPNCRQPTAAPVRSWLIYLGLTTAFIIGLVVPLTQEDPTAYTGRAYLWSLAWQAMSDPAEFWYGRGVRGVQHLSDLGFVLLPVYSVHNQWLQVLFSAGIIGFVLFVAALILMLRNAHGAYTLVIGTVLVPAFVLAVTERPWPIDSLDAFTWVLPATLLSYPAIRRRRRPVAGPPPPNLGNQPTGDPVTVGRVS